MVAWMLSVKVKLNESSKVHGKNFALNWRRQEWGRTRAALWCGSCLQGEQQRAVLGEVQRLCPKHCFLLFFGLFILLRVQKEADELSNKLKCAWETKWLSPFSRTPEGHLSVVDKEQSCVTERRLRIKQASLSHCWSQRLANQVVVCSSVQYRTDLWCFYWSAFTFQILKWCGSITNSVVVAALWLHC